MISPVKFATFYRGIFDIRGSENGHFQLCQLEKMETKSNSFCSRKTFSEGTNKIWQPEFEKKREENQVCVILENQLNYQRPTRDDRVLGKPPQKACPRADLVENDWPGALETLHIAPGTCKVGFRSTIGALSPFRTPQGEVLAPGSPTQFRFLKTDSTGTPTRVSGKLLIR